MPFELPLPRHLKIQGWKVKIRDKERLEPPHITVMRKQDEWRIGLRDKQFLVPPGGSAGEIDPEGWGAIELSWASLQNAWDTKYPENPIQSTEVYEDEQR